jgi:hypothetical protein
VEKFREFLLTVHFDGTLPRLFFNKFTQPNTFKEPTEQLHVIEYGAYQELLKQNEELKQKLEVAKRALEFYGDERSWITTNENEFSKVKRTLVKKEEDIESFGYQSSPEDKNIVITIAGNLARQALKEIGE